MIKAVVFDLDGVLIDSEPVYMDHEYLKVLEYLPDLKKEALMPTVGMSMKMYHAFMANLLGFEVDSQEYRNYRNNAGPKLTINYKEIMRAHARETLTKIKQMGLRIALASSGDYQEIMKVLSQCEIMDFFEVICSGDMFAQAKPNPEIYLTTFQKMGLKSEECLVVEDSELGLAAGIASGAHVCCMKETRFNFKQQGAEYYIDDLSQIIDILAKQIKAVFFDIDGTLTDMTTHQMPASNLQALMQLKEKGIKTIICTGRASVEIKEANIIDETIFDGAIYLNGQYCQYEGKLVSDHPYDKQQLIALKQFLMEKDISCVFFSNDETFTNKVDERLIKAQGIIGSPIPDVRSIEHLEDEIVYQTCPSVNEQEQEELMSKVSGMKMARWADCAIDMLSSAGGKDQGIKDLCHAMGIQPEQTMSFGDGSNDIPMLETTQIGIAMGNAKETVKQRANYITSRFDENGIWNALKYFKVI